MTSPAYFGGVVVVVVDLVVVVGGVVGAVAVEPSGAVVVVVPGVPGAGAADGSVAGGVAVGAEASVEVEDVVVVLLEASSAFFWQAPSAKLEAASTAAVAIRLERQVMDVMKWLPREKTQVRPFNRCRAGQFPKK